MQGKKRKPRGKSSGQLSTLNEHAAGLDVGSTFHVVAVPGNRDEQPVRTFRSFSGDLHKMADWLGNVGIKTVAMESTGVYWIPVFEILESRGFEVLLVDDAIAQAVTEYQHQRDQSVQGSDMTSLGFLAHEMRNLLSTSMLSFEALARGSVGIRGSTSALLRRSLQRMRVLIDRTLAEARLEAGSQKPERVSIAELIEEMEVVATIDTNRDGIQHDPSETCAPRCLANAGG